MLLKNSFIDKTLLKKEISSLIWLLTLATILLMFTLPYSYYVYAKSKDFYYNNDDFIIVDDTDNLIVEDISIVTADVVMERTTRYLLGQLEQRSYTQNFTLLLFPILVAAFIMGRDRKDKSIDILSAMPFTKKQIFFSKLLSGLIICLFPYLVIAALSLMLRLFYAELSMVYPLVLLLKWFVKSIVALVLIYCSGILVGTLISPTQGIFIITPIFTIFPIGFGTLVYFNISLLPFLNQFTNKYQVIERYLMLISPAYLALHSNIQLFVSRYLFGSKYCIMASMALIFMLVVLSYTLYKKHHIEHSSDFLLYPKLNGLFVVGVTICSALFTAPILFILFRNQVSVVLGYLLGGAIGFFFANYFVKKKVLN